MTRTILITGAGTGIGKDTAKKLIENRPCLLYTSDAPDE